MFWTIKSEKEIEEIRVTKFSDYGPKFFGQKNLKALTLSEAIYYEPAKAKKELGR